MEFLEYIKIYLSYIETIRIFKSPLPNVYFIYIQFKNTEYSNIFYNTFNYSKLSSLDKEFFVFGEVLSLKQKEKFINTLNANDHITMNFNYFCSTPKTIKDHRKKKTNILEIETNVNTESFKSNLSPLNLKKNMEMSSSITTIEETKVCPICLETLDSSKLNEITMSFHSQNNGTIFVLCGHCFHIDCLLRLDDEKCPLCRFDLSPANVSSCSLCNVTKDLWMCIICGSINCGDNGDSTNHREQHYINTGHIYARGINDYNVTFDFTRKTTLNRWFQNMMLTGNNNIIEEHKESISEYNTQYITEDEMKINKPNHHDELVSEFAKNPKEKVEYILGEYNSIISSQVESQRSYYINYINKIEETTIEEVGKLNAQIKELEIQVESLNKYKQNTSEERKIYTENLKSVLKEENEIELLTQKKDEEFKKMVEVKNKLEEALNQSKIKNNVTLKDLDKEILEIDQEIDECVKHINAIHEISKRKDAGEIQGSSIRVLNFDNKGKKGKKK